MQKVLRLILFVRWVYIITGPPQTPYENGQYWGTLTFPSDYPFKPPAIRMMTPSGRFQTSTRLCLSISDFHPKSFNPAWEVSTILIGLLSFMTSEEMTTGSISASESQRKQLAFMSRWWNSTGGGLPVGSSQGKIGAGDGGARFKNDWADIDRENWTWMINNQVDIKTGRISLPPPKQIAGDMQQPGGDVSSKTGAVANSMIANNTRNLQIARNGQSWIGRNKFYVITAIVVAWVAIGRMFTEYTS